MRIGFGYDVHKLTEDRPLILGGVTIPHEQGLLGHSDADVLLHAIADALLGAVALGDIGLHFPDTDPELEGLDSMALLLDVYNLVKKEGYLLSNMDATLAMQRPKLRPYIDAMRKRIASVLELDLNQVSIKATTTEKLGFVGKEEGVAAYAICLLQKEETEMK